MITKLSNAQIQVLPEYREKWLAIGLSTDQNYSRVQELMKRYYVEILHRPEPKTILIYPSPLSAGIAANLITYLLGAKNIQVSDQVWNQVSDQVSDQVWKQVSDQVWNQVWKQVIDQVSDQVIDQVRDQVMDQVWDQVSDQVSDQVWNQVSDQVWNQVRDQVWKQVMDQVRNQVSDQVSDQVIWPYWNGAFEASWLGFYEYFIDQFPTMQISKRNEIKLLSEIAQCSGPIWPLAEHCIVSAKPVELNRKDDMLHKNHAPAIVYADGFCVWTLNGVRVPRWLAEQRDSEIDPRELLNIENVDVRREFVRKVGIERICHAFDAKILDKKGDYELLGLDLQDGRRRPYLKMLNPSIQAWHVEGVEPGCATVQQALAWRNGTEIEPEVLT